MTFDIKKFSTAKWTPRTAKISTPELANWFKDGAEACCVVRNLDGEEVARANEAAGNASKRSGIAAGLAGNNTEIADAIRALVGAAGDIPSDHMRRLEMLQMGSVEPAFDLPTALSLAKHLPATFLVLTNKIIDLTGMGAEPGKPKGSGKSRASGPQ